jgi:serine protease Do
VFAVLPAAAQAPSRPSRLPELSLGDGADDDAVSAPGQTTNNSVLDSADPVSPAPLTPRELYEHVRRGVVVIERGGAPTAIGTVLAGDGRVLTALSGLGGADDADVRYADGTGVHATLGYSDRTLDLALLTPDSGRRTEGLSASEADPADTQMRAMLPGKGAHLGPARVGFKGRADAHAHGGGALLGMWNVDVQGTPVAGAPLLDPAGSVVAVLVRACRGPARVESVESPGAWPTSPNPGVRSDRSPNLRDSECQPVVMGAPVSAVRSFLARASTPPDAPVSSAPWLGIRGEPQDAGGLHGVRVVDVAPASPAEKAGLKPAADVIVAVDGRPIERAEALGESIGKHAIGDTVKLLVFGGGKFREVAAILRPAPDGAPQR